MTQSHSDVLIIGGGVIGVCSAYYLAQAGLSVRLLEQERIGSGSSWANAGLVTPSHCVPLAAPGVPKKVLAWMFRPSSPFHLRLRPDLKLFTWLWRFMGYCNRKHLHRSMPVLSDLSRMSSRLYLELAQDPQLNFDFCAAGLLKLAATDKGLEDIITEARLQQTIGVESEILQADQIKRFLPGVPNQARGGIFYPQDQHLNPAKFVTQLAGRLTLQQVAIHTETEVIDFITADRQLRGVKTTCGQFTADQFVLAAGFSSSQLARQLRLRLPVQPAKGYSITVDRPARYPDMPLLLSEAKVAVTPMGDALRFAGTLELAGDDRRMNLKRLRAIARAVPRYLPELEIKDSSVRQIWRGFRPCSPDGLPIIGRTRRYSNLILATGHAMIGQSLGPVTGLLVAQLLSEQEPVIDLEPLSPNRF